MTISYRSLFLSVCLTASSTMSSLSIAQDDTKPKSTEPKPAANTPANSDSPLEAKPKPNVDVPTDRKEPKKVDEPVAKEGKKSDANQPPKSESKEQNKPVDKQNQKAEKNNENPNPPKQSTKSTAANAKIPLPKLGSNTNEFIPGMPWRIHDIRRPRPKPVQPGKIDTAPPSDARVLFGGKDLSEWYHPGMEDEIFEPQWKIHQEGYFEIEPHSGSILTLDSFGSCQLHIEWMIPEGTTGSSQGRGNSGIKFMERYEVQVLDSFNNKTYADGQAASIYGQYPPLVNASREQGQWQSYEIFFEAPKYEGGKLIKAPNLTVIHNGILVQLHRELTGPTGLRGSGKEAVPPVAPLMLQDHSNRIRFRNIWIRELGSE
jgi:Domain of Unknown Function (DUF1080)